jgi:hypothetical protein
MNLAPAPTLLAAPAGVAKVMEYGVQGADIPLSAGPRYRVAVKRLFFGSLECWGTFDSEMDFSMTHTADGDEIRFYIASQLAS